MARRAGLAFTLALCACSLGPDPAATGPSHAPSPVVAPASPVPLILPIAAPAPSTPSQPSSGRFGVRWRAQLPGLDTGADDTQAVIVAGGEVFVSMPVLAGVHDEIDVFDLQTGAKLRTAKLVHTRLVATHDQLVATNGDDEFGLDKKSLRPTWSARASLDYAVGEYLLDAPPSKEHPRLRLRRASDGTIVWENDERLFMAAGTWPRIDGATLYVQAYVGAYSDRVAALDLATGAVRWRTEGYLRSASGGHVVIQEARFDRPSVRILDEHGDVRWRGEGAYVWARGNVAFAVTAESTTAIDLSWNRVLWRRTHVSALEADDRWVYGTSSTGALEIMDSASGELVGEMQLGFQSVDLVFSGAPVVRVGAWLFALGALSGTEPRKPVLASGCLVVMGCPGNSYVPVGAKVTINGTTATTDRRGCFGARPMVGLGPAHVEVASGTTTPIELDTPFSTAVVFDRAPVTLSASYIGAGCHDSVPGGFP